MLKGTCGVSSSGVLPDYNMHEDAGKARAASRSSDRTGAFVADD
jgi:hypothetical protein